MTDKLGIDIVFPPVHDVALPHISGPILKGYLDRNIGESTTRCVDLNQRFFAQRVFGSSYQQTLSSHRSAFIQAESVEDAIETTIEFDQWIRDACKAWEERNAGNRLSFRFFNSGVDRRNPEEVAAASQAPSVFDDIFLDYLRHSAADLVGIGIGVEDQIIPAFRLAHLLREHHPTRTIVIGGNLVSRVYPKLSGALGDLWDHLVIREGEEPFAAIAKELILERRGAVSDPRVISAANQAKADIIAPFANEGLPITDISSTATPDFSDLPVDSYCSLKPMLPILASRKCYWGRCSFCTIHSAWDDAPRQDTPERVFATLQGLVDRYGVRTFRFVDEACPPDFLGKLSLLINDSDLHIEFEVYAIAERRFRNRDFVLSLGRAGCRQAYFGLESADKATLLAMAKGINQVHAYPEIFALCAEAGIHVYVYSMFGFPGSTQEAEQKTAAYLRQEHNIHTATISSFVPVTGSPFAMENGPALVHDDGMTEDYSLFAPGSGAAQDAGQLGAEAAERTLDEVLGQRADLALTTLLNDEVRLALSGRFGPNFAQLVSTNGSGAAHRILSTAIAEARRERIHRSL